MLRVLVVDDMPVFVAYMETIIPWEVHGFSLVGSAKDGQEALSMAESLKPDIVLTDITMPHMDGLALTEALKTLLPNVSVVMITGHTEFQYARSALRLGVSDYLVKPFEAQELLITLLKLKQEHQNSQAFQIEYADFESLKSATLLRQLLLAQSVEFQEDSIKRDYGNLQIITTLLNTYGIRVATLSVPSDALERSSLERILIETLADGRVLYHFTDYDDHLVVLLCYPDSKDHAFYRDEMDHLINGILEKLELQVHFGISELQVLGEKPPQAEMALSKIAVILKQGYSQALEQLAEVKGATTFNPGIKQQRVAMEMKAFLDGHYMNPNLSMEMVSRALLINQTDLRAAFKAETSFTMTEYVLKCRMEQAKALMETTQHKLSQISEMVGYDDQAYFSRCYKRYFGTAPLKHGRADK